MPERSCDVLIAGGGLGGVAAALAATARGLDVVMSEPTDWIGGQLTSQAVPPDEHRWIERHGCTATYRKLRDGIRAHYRAHFPLTDAARLAPELNPGACTASRLGHEPRVALAVVEAMLAPALAAGRLELLLRHAPVRADVDRDRVEAVTLRGPAGERTVAADWFLDATETGALLPIAGAEHVTGFESASRTGEPHAPDADQPDNLPPVTGLLRARPPRGRGPHDRPARRLRALRGPLQLGRAGPAHAAPGAAPARAQPGRGPAGDRPGLRRPRARQGPGASAGSPRAGCSCRAPTAATSRS